MYQSFLVICVIYTVQVLAGRDVRGLSMLRMGKRSYLPPLVPPSYDVPGEELAERQLLGAPRMGKDLEEFDVPRYQDVRVPPVPRLGYEEYVNEIRRELGAEPVYNTIPSYGRQKRSADLTDEQVDSEIEAESEHTQEKRALPRYGLVERDAGHPFPRLGLVERDQPFPRLGLRSFPRIGLRDAENVPFPRLGLRSSDDLDEVERALPRYGLRDTDEQEKRAMSMLRMGKRDDDTNEAAQKRKMSMLRMGKRAMSMLRMGKRGDMSMLRMGRSDPEGTKRAMSMLRMGRSQSDANVDEEKRAMSMLRMGRSYESEAAKKAMSMLRMGRAMSMLRMGRSSELPEEEGASPEKRKMSMLRMGRGMSMLRMGKRSTDDEKRAMSMLRMGKKSDQLESQDES